MGREDDEQEGRGFKVEDKRRFDPEGREREEAPADSGPRPGASQARVLDAEGRSLPELDFSTFVLSLATSAVAHLGETPLPDGSTRKDLALAKQTIDILGMLRDKTAGNLTEEEARLLDDILYDLRLRFIGAKK